MLSKTLAAGVTAAAILGLNLVPPTAASAASLYFYGPSYTTHAMHNGKWSTEVCHVKYRWGTSHGKRIKVKVSTECHWVAPPPPPPKHFNKLPFHKPPPPPKKY